MKNNNKPWWKNPALIIPIIILCVTTGSFIFNLTQKKSPYLYLEYSGFKQRVDKREINFGVRLINTGEKSAQNVIVIFPPLSQANLMLSRETSKVYKCYGKDDIIFIDLEDRKIHPTIGESNPIIFNITVRVRKKVYLEEIILHYIIKCNEGEFENKISLKDIILIEEQW